MLHTAGVSRYGGPQWVRFASRQLAPTAPATTVFIALRGGTRGGGGGGWGRRLGGGGGTRINLNKVSSAKVSVELLGGVPATYQGLLQPPKGTELQGGSGKVGGGGGGWGGASVVVSRRTVRSRHSPPIRDCPKPATYVQLRS